MEKTMEQSMYIKFKSKKSKPHVNGKSPSTNATQITKTEKSYDVQLEFKHRITQCTVLEVKVIEGLGATMDVVLVNGVLHEGDEIIVCGFQVALILFSSLTETIGDSFRPYFADLQALLLKCLQDETSNNVRVAALNYIPILYTQIKFCEFIPSILNVSRQCLASGDEDVAIIAYEIFDELIESPAPLLGDSVKAIVKFSIEVCSSPNLDSSTRHQAIQIISWLAKFKSSSHNSWAVRDPEQVVRGASSFALGQFAEYLQPEIISHYESVLPCILNGLEDSSDEVKLNRYYYKHMGIGMVLVVSKELLALTRKELGILPKDSIHYSATRKGFRNQIKNLWWKKRKEDSTENQGCYYREIWCTGM
ncbi:unnamed protein product [Lactuca virosa]|uniref:IPO4/5-like TPR repeats domain-containing protein n=1 Tax=Lactuca virosa TaxID=75947 RepID=A0AAU9P0S9_9ASTR|nr:unnamed protein product [Lactuca virosa]